MPKPKVILQLYPMFRAEDRADRESADGNKNRVGEPPAVNHQSAPRESHEE